MQSIKVETNNNIVDLCVLTETWLKLDDTLTVPWICPIGYKAISILGTGRTGGGIASVHRADNNVKLDKNHTKSKMEGATFMYHCLSYTHDTNKVHFSTNKQHNTTDFVIAPKKSNYIQNVKQGELFSDHYMVLFDIMEPTNIWKFNTVAYNKAKAIYKDELSKDLAREFNYQ